MASGERTETTNATVASQGATTHGAAVSAPAATTAAASGSMAATPLERARISCDMNARYHACREAYLDTLHRWFMFGVIALGAAAVVDILPHGWEWFKGVFAAGAALLGALDLTFDLSNRARMHALMKRRYFELLADVIEGKKNLEEMQAAINRYNADEEPAYHALLSSCWNAAQEMVYGNEALALKIPLHHLALKNWMRFGSKRYSLNPSRHDSQRNLDSVHQTQTQS